MLTISHVKYSPRSSRRGLYFEFSFLLLIFCDSSQHLRSPTRHALIPVCNLMGAGACPALTIRRHVLLDTGTIRGVPGNTLPCDLCTAPQINFSLIKAESGRVSKKINLHTTLCFLMIVIEHEVNKHRTIHFIGVSVNVFLIFFSNLFFDLLNAWLNPLTGISSCGSWQMILLSITFISSCFFNL